MSEPPGGSDGGSPRLGSMFGRYRIESVVGRGGMGVVVRATDTELERTVALKFVAPELAGDPAVRERFMRESRLAAAIEHPNIVPVHEAGEANGILFIAMRAIPGPDLATVLRREAPLDRERTLRIATALADALDAAHRRGLVHRDVKPGNVLLEPGDDGRPEWPWLTDFGLTRRMAETAPLTVGGPLGTIDYLAPELIDGGAVGPWTDQYSLACLIVHCLTGAPPWQGPTDAAVLYAHVHADRAALLERMTGERTAAVLGRGLATTGSERFPDCRSLVAALGEAMAADAAADASRPLTAPMAGSAAVPVARSTPTAGAGPPPATPAPSPAPDPAGAAGPAGAADRPTSPVTPVPGASGGRGDRRHRRWVPILVVALGALVGAGGLLALAGGGRVVAPEPSPGPSGATGSTDLVDGRLTGPAGVIVFAGGPSLAELDLWAIRPDGSGLRRLTDAPGAERWPSVTRDGRSIVYTAGPIGSRDVWLLPLDTGVPRQLTRDKGDDHGAAISPDGSRIAWSSDRDGTDDLFLMEDDGDGFVERTAVNLTKEPRMEWDHTQAFPAWDPTGTWIAFSSNEGASSDILTLIPGKPASLKMLTEDIWADNAPTVGPDGTIAFIGERGHFDQEVYLIAPGGAPERLTQLGDDASSPVFSPDGARLIVTAGRFRNALEPIETRLVQVSARTGVKLGAVKTGMAISTDADWVPALVLVLDEPDPSVSVSPSSSP